jgi:hypothetical protein
MTRHHHDRQPEIRLFCRVGGAAKAPMTAVVQPVIKHERQGQGGRSGPHAGLL